jgi:serine/threonine protein phosphatase PrpC
MGTDSSIMLILVILFCVSTGLIAVKLLLLRTKKQETDIMDDEFSNGIKAGNAQFIGEKENQSDYFTILPSEDGLLAVIASGLTDNKQGKMSAMITVETLKDNFRKGLHKTIGGNDFFLESFRIMPKRMNELLNSNKVGATLIAVLIENGVMHYASVGDSVLFLLRNGELINVNDINAKEIRTGELSIGSKDVAMLASHGAYESLTEMEIVWQLSTRDHPYQKCQKLIKRMRQKRTGSRRNSTLVVLEEMTTKGLAWGRAYGA